MKVITIFGSALPESGSKEYQRAYEVGYSFGKQGLAVCSGGYQGIMEAVSRGARDAGSKSIGVTVDLFNRVPNPYLSELIETNSLFERINKMIELADAFLILPGGTGTLLEVATVWEFVNKKFLKQKPIAAAGKPWIEIIKSMDKQLKKEGRTTGIINTFKDTIEAVKFIIESLNQK